MSDNFIRFISTDPHHVPDIDAREHMVRVVRQAFPKADSVEELVHDEVSFVDAGANFEAAFCPACDAELDGDWWASEMEAAFDAEAVVLDIILPCCGDASSLNDLRYEWAQGFARYVIEVTNPGAGDVPESLMSALSQHLGGAVRAIWAHY